MKIEDGVITSYRLRPLPAAQVKLHGWYLHMDLEHQKGPAKWGQKPYGAWFYEWTPEGWRTETGCLDCGPFEPDALFLGPVDMAVFEGKNA